ncbi:hypothetical protein [Clavibacter sp. VKM Ac-2872]|uniref:hypothetical protein n=1 Tax=Clavibacter sp. VKM Ac-2872 TaxID=2783812 RepID=UPI00188D258B|nr:hypothetical protein [Clavibacter sp. VKM Ac-2872]MBF4622964.1 hypothetical protein [Clavibacter sp. VKM Ac-2872]
MPLTPSRNELALLNSLAGGHALIFTNTLDVLNVDESELSTWGAEGALRATFIREVLRGLHVPLNTIDPHGIQVSGARIEGLLDLNHVSTLLPINFTACLFAGGLTAVSSDIARLNMAASVILAPLAGRPESVILQDARIRGQLNLSKVKITNTTAAALNADGCVIDGDAFLNDGFEARGHGPTSAVRFLGAQITGQLGMSGAKLINLAGPALSCDNADMGALFIDESFTAIGRGREGTVRLPHSHIRGQFVASGATIHNPEGLALHANSATFDGGVYLNSAFVATAKSVGGGVRFMGARFLREVDLTNSDISDADGPALLLDDAQIAGALLFGSGFSASGSGAGDAFASSARRLQASLR